MKPHGRGSNGRAARPGPARGRWQGPGGGQLCAIPHVCRRRRRLFQAVCPWAVFQVEGATATRGRRAPPSLLLWSALSHQEGCPSISPSCDPSPRAPRAGAQSAPAIQVLVTGLSLLPSGPPCAKMGRLSVPLARPEGQPQLSATPAWKCRAHPCAPPIGESRSRGPTQRSLGNVVPARPPFPAPRWEEQGS